MHLGRRPYWLPDQIGSGNRKLIVLNRCEYLAKIRIEVQLWQEILKKYGLLTLILLFVLKIRE